MTAICVLATANMAAAAPFAYVANSGTKNVSVIDTADNTVKATVALPLDSVNGLPYAYSVAVGASGQYAYVGLQTANEIAVIDTATKAVVRRIGLGTENPGGLAVNAAETRLYVASNLSDTLIVMDITWIHLGFAPVEVGRVTVGNNPEGVVLSALGDKAYVSSATDGTVTEITLDEAQNIYTPSTPIAVGSKPLGLALSSNGSKLYVADGFGVAAVIDTATKTKTDLFVGTGTVSVAVKSDDSKVYAPANTDNLLYVIDGATDVVSGTQYAVASGPFGSAMAPNNDLYLAMHDSDNVKVFNTTSNTVTATIALPAGAKPTSLGDFIGPPQFIRTITSSSDSANCPILPLGAVAVVDNSSRKFSITPAAGKSCDILVDGVSVAGQPTGYEFTNVTADHTIAASEILAGTYRTVTTSWITSVGGNLVSTPFGINKGSSSARFPTTTAVDLKCATGFTATNWTGACTGTVGATCTLAAQVPDQTAGATCVLAGGSGPVWNFTKQSYHQTCNEAVAAAATNDVIKVSNLWTGGCTTTGTATLVTLSGNWAPDYSSQSGSVSMGALTITNVGVIADNLTI
jgi:YVTN family beta-propeller protein